MTLKFTNKMLKGVFGSGKRCLGRRLFCQSSAAGMDETTTALASGLLAGKRSALARSITLAESSRDDHKEQAMLLLNDVMKRRSDMKEAENGNSSQEKSGKQPLFAKGLTMRLGIAGPPGAGKSTFIEQLGTRLIENHGHRVAVIPVDPSSHISGGSILGDKTRMESLSINPDAYVRASPTRGVLGGIAEHTCDVISLCESAGYDVVIVESVGLGQSEVDIDTDVDMLLMVVPPGGGDGLQASKKGIMEAADMVAVNKADGDLLAQAKHTRADYAGSMAFIRQKHPNWRPEVLMMSARTGKGLQTLENKLATFHHDMMAQGTLQVRKPLQSIEISDGHIYKS